MHDVELELKAEDLTFDEGGNVRRIIRIKPPILDRDEELVGPPIPAPPSLVCGGGLDPADMAGTDLPMIHELDRILNLAARSLGSLDLQGAREADAAMFYKVCHP